LPKKGGGQPGPGAFTGIGLMLAVSTGLGYWLGAWLDGRWHTSPWLSLVGLLFGMGAGFLEVARLLKRFGE
jgi:F0F1-type ATP synthase assembly protein I